MAEPGWQNAIRRFFDILFHELTGLVSVNLLFLLTAWPVLTVGPALSALARVTAEVAEGRCAHPARAYLSYFRIRIPATLICGLALLAGFGALGCALFFYSRMTGASPLALPFVSLSLLGLLAVTGVSVHWLPALTAEEVHPLSLLKRSAKRVLTRIPATLAAAILILGLLIVQALAFPVALPLTLTVGFSVPALVGAIAQAEKAA